jgi:hypothetical protein
MKAAIVIGLMALAGALPIVFHYEKPYSADNIPPQIVGTWQGQGKLVGQPTGLDYRDERLRQDISITIHPDGSVSGSVTGFAGAEEVRLVNCTVKKNRGPVGRRINFWTDHIIRGDLEGSFAPGDTLRIKPMTMPFNVDPDGSLKGSIFSSEGSRRKFKPTYREISLKNE